MGNSRVTPIFLCWLLCCLLSSSLLHAERCTSNLIKDLLIVSEIDAKLNTRFPVMYNNFLQGGYINMPSARMGCSGEFAFGYSSVPPYRNYNGRCQLLDFLEITGNYRIFKGVDDPILTPMGFGDFSDKGANIKMALFSPEASQYRLPGLAIGFDDFMGTRNFQASYIVLTQVLPDFNVEMTLGFGQQRLRGWFGGFAWFPFRQNECSYLKGLSFALEYDAVPYKSHHIERHPKGRETRCPLNIGLNYRLFDTFDFSLSYVRGHKVAFAASAFYNFGESKGFIPKHDMTAPYCAPIITEEIGFLRPEESLLQDLIYAYRDQGFDLFEAWLTGCDYRTLRLKVFNCTYREECIVRERLNALVACLTPDNIDNVVIVMDCEGFPIQEYRYDMQFVRSYAAGEMCAYELSILTPECEVSCIDPCESRLLFLKKREMCTFVLLPKVQSLFGSAKGKFKYALGLSLLTEGYLPYDVFYTVSLGYLPLSNLYDISDMDRLNPSQLINVRTDIINYYKQKSITIDQAYLQKISNWGRGFYTSSQIGYFEQEYGGVAFECLYYPVKSPWAIGVEGALVRKRTYEDLFSFTDRIRKLDGFRPTYRHFLGSQYFVNLYYDWREASMDFRISAGKFLANDYGVRYEIGRYFPSGLRVSFWYTQTNGHDRVNGHTYYDKGIAFSVPLDMFYTCCSRSRWGYGMSAWLRDVGVRSFTGQPLYNLINECRQ